MGTTTGPLVFTGISTYSNDLQSILARAVSIAQLPITNLQNRESDNVSRKSALVALNPAVASLGSSVAALGTLAANLGLVASSSDSSTVSVVNTGASSPASYTLSQITSLAAAASETSTVSYADTTTAPVSSTSAVDLVVGSHTYHLSLTSLTNNLNGIRDAINASGAGVTASIITAGSNADYLSISSNSTGATTLQLNDVAAGTNLITGANQGSDANFQLNGIPVVRSGNSINDLIPGVSFQLLGTTTGTGTVNLSLATDGSQLSSALQTFVSSYNAVVDQVAQQTGPSAGLLGGDLLIRNISSDLHQLGGYLANGSSIQSLSDLGVTFDTTGHLSFNQSTVTGLSSSQVSDAFKFLGSSTAGFASLASNFTELSDPVSGLIRIQEDGYDSANTQLSSQITVLTNRAALAQNSLTAQLQQADALIAQMQSQQTNVTASIQSLNYVLYGRTLSATGQ